MNGPPAQNINDEDMIPPLIGPNGEVIAPARPANPAPVAQPPPVQPAPVQPAPVQQQAPAVAEALPSVNKLSLPKLIEAIKKVDIAFVERAINDPSNKTILKRFIDIPNGYENLPEPKPAFKYTALIAAVLTKDEPLIELILMKMADLGLQLAIGMADTTNNTAADYAYKLGSAKIAQMIVQAASAPSKEEQPKGEVTFSKNPECGSPLECVLKFSNNASEINPVLEDEKYMKTLTTTKVFKALITGIQAYQRNKTLIGEAIGKILDNVIKNKTGVPNIGEIWKSNTSILKGISYPDADKQYTLFMYIAMTPGGDGNLMKIFLSRIPYAYIVAKDVDGNTLLHHLAKTPGPEKEELFDFLKTSNKYAPTLMNNNNETPVFLAVKNNNTAIALKIISDEKVVNDKNINYQDALGNTLLIEATKVKNTAVLEKINTFSMLDHDIKNKEGKKAIDYVVELGKVYTQPTARKTFKLSSAPLFSTDDITALNNFKYMFWMFRDTSVCPVCLTYSDSNEGCIYIIHKCDEHSTTKHEELFNNINRNGNIEWCKICGDVAFHGHHVYNEINQPLGQNKPWKTNEPNYYQKNNDLTDSTCIYSGGLGYLQKFNRLYALYNEICKIMKEISKGKKILKSEGKTRAVTAMWNAAKPVIKDGVEQPNPDILPHAKEIFDKLQADFNPVFMQYKGFVPGTQRETNFITEKISSNEKNQKIKLVDSLFEEFGVKFDCDLSKPIDAPTDQQPSNVAATVPEVEGEEEPKVQTPNQKERDKELKQNHKFLYEELEKVRQTQGFPPYSREPEEVDIPGPKGQIEEAKAYLHGGKYSIEVIVPAPPAPVVQQEEGAEQPPPAPIVNMVDKVFKCAYDQRQVHWGDSPDKPRNVYMFTHFQAGTNGSHIKHDQDSQIVCAAHIREFWPISFYEIPSDDYISISWGYPAGAACSLAPGECRGHIYPDQMNSIPSEEFYLPTDSDQTPLDNPDDPNTPLDPKVLGDKFKKEYNDIFTRNHIMFDYDQWTQMDVEIRKGGGNGEYIMNIGDLIQEGKELQCAIPPRQQKAGIRIKTYRRKVDLRRVTRRV